ncbi:ATP-binding cassette domain-containing protein [uncultured Flavobacterium sp.]|uniref:ATP-binding cassette domain-containing protein n=1 Tax=uncultured Flavobacterium sp. TaxID=165435 RepID=UPI0030EB81E5|tara:strand:- start:66786 stop:67262 length:477 start_codon:yes stop_codon:yes gene_type:complete
MKNLLEVDSVFKRYGEKLILSDVYLKCKTGNIIGLLGRNGSGKSTLLKIIFGVIEAETKFIRINGTVKEHVNQLMKDVGYLPQHNFIPDNLTVKKAIDLSIQKEKRIEFYSDKLINSVLDNKISNLSTVLRNQINSSKFVLLDEPYNGLAPVMINKVN